jgi:hypothetical protein
MILIKIAPRSRVPLEELKVAAVAKHFQLKYNVKVNYFGRVSPTS